MAVAVKVLQRTHLKTLIIVGGYLKSRYIFSVKIKKHACVAETFGKILKVKNGADGVGFKKLNYDGHQLC